MVNIAHGSFYMIGAFAAATVAATVDGLAGLVLAVVVGPVVVAVLAAVVEVIALRRLYESEHLMQLLATFAFLLIFADVVQFLWGEQPRSVTQPDPIGGAMSLGGVIFPRYSLFLIAVTVLLAVGLGAAHEPYRARARHPRGGRRPADARDGRCERAGAAHGGVRPGRGAGRLRGVLAAPQTTARLGMDVDIIVESFAVVIIGGLGSLPGTAVGALRVGLTFTFGIFFVPEAALAIVFLVMVGVLVWRPTDCSEWRRHDPTRNPPRRWGGPRPSS